MVLCHQGVTERTCPLPHQGLGATPPVTKGYGCVEECEAAKPLSIPKEGSSLSKFLLSHLPLI